MEKPQNKSHTSKSFRNRITAKLENMELNTGFKASVVAALVVLKPSHGTLSYSIIQNITSNPIVLATYNNLMSYYLTTGSFEYLIGAAAVGVISIAHKKGLSIMYGRKKGSSKTA